MQICGCANVQMNSEINTKFTNMEIINILLPAVLTILGNYFFYIYIKNSVDQSIEDFKISYSGIFKERIDIYRQCLKYIIDIDYKIRSFRLNGNEETSNAIFSLINEFINYILINRPFISASLIKKINEIRSKYQQVFDKNVLSYGLKGQIPADEHNKFFIDAIKSINLLNDKEFKELEDSIILEMRKDMRVI